MSNEKRSLPELSDISRAVATYRAEYGAAEYGAAEYGAAEYGAAEYGAAEYGATPCGETWLTANSFTYSALIDTERAVCLGDPSGAQTGGALELASLAIGLTGYPERLQAVARSVHFLDVADAVDDSELTHARALLGYISGLVGATATDFGLLATLLATLQAEREVLRDAALERVTLFLNLKTEEAQKELLDSARALCAWMVRSGGEWAELCRSSNGCADLAEAEAALDSGAWAEVLAVDVRSDWTSVGDVARADRFRMRLSNGGVDCTIYGTLDSAGACSANRFEYASVAGVAVDAPLDGSDRSELTAFCASRYFGG